MLTRMSVLIILGLLSLSLGCSAPTDIDAPRLSTGQPLPPNSCGSYVYTYGGGSESGGLTFYQSECSPEYTVFYRLGGVLYEYNSSFSLGNAAGEDFCAVFSSVYSCVHPPFDWCEVDPDCSGAHPSHEQGWES